MTDKDHPQNDYSVNALSARLGYDRRTISKAVVHLTPTREDGKTKFYRLADVEAAMKAKPDKSLKDEKLTEEIRKLRIRNDRDDGKTVLKTEVAGAIRRALAGVATISESKLVNEWPAVVSGLDVPKAREYGKRLHDGLMAECQKLEREFPL